MIWSGPKFCGEYFWFWSDHWLIDKFWKNWQETCQYWQVLKIPPNRCPQNSGALQNRGEAVPIPCKIASIPGSTSSERFFATFFIDKFWIGLTRNLSILTTSENTFKSLSAELRWTPESQRGRPNTIHDRQYTWFYASPMILYDFLDWQLSQSKLSHLKL